MFKDLLTGHSLEDWSYFIIYYLKSIIQLNLVDFEKWYLLLINYINIYQLDFLNEKLATKAAHDKIIKQSI